MIYKLTLKSPAKINLTLDIFPEDKKGYHPINTIFQSISLCDTLTIEMNKEKKGLIFKCDNTALENDKNNSIAKVYDTLSRYLNKQFSITVTLEKNIPMKSGLGGGSSNAATFLKGMNTLFNLELCNEEMAAIGAPIGMDIPFFIQNSETAQGLHYGDIVIPVPCKIELGILLCMGPTLISTKEAYAKIDEYKLTENIEKSDSLLEELKSEKIIDLKSINKYIHNDFEELLWREEDNLAILRENLIEIGKGTINTKEIHITGSGGCIYHLFDLKNTKDIQKIATDLNKTYDIWTFVGKTNATHSQKHPQTY